MIWETDPNIFVFRDHARHGANKMHVRRLNLRDWIRIDSTYIDQMKLRHRLLDERTDDVFASIRPNETTDACKEEFFDLVTQHLPERFPDIFERHGDVMHNKVLGTEINLVNDGEDLLVKASRMTQEDWLIMERQDSGEYVLTAAVLCFPMRWSLHEKLNKTMLGIHQPVEDFKQHLLAKVNSLFVQLKPHASVWRANWGVYHDLEGPLDLFVPASHASEMTGKISEFDAEKTGRDILLRCEYQTLRKLPKSGCVVFSIRTYQRPLQELNHQPVECSKDLITSIQNLSPTAYEYKGACYWGDATIKYLQMSMARRKRERHAQKFLAGVFIVASVSILVSAWSRRGVNVKWIK